MSKYYHHVVGRTTIKIKIGHNAIIPPSYKKSSALIISRCSFLQSQILKILYSTHGPEISEASKISRENRSPNARMDFLCSKQFGVDDDILLKVFAYSQEIFRDVYGLRNILAHETWMTCDDYRFKILLSKIEEEERLLKITGRLEFDEKCTSAEVFNAQVRYIRSIKIISSNDLENALRDISLCEWMLMTINHILKEEDAKKRNDLRMAFLTFRGTSHLFSKDRGASGKVDVRSSKEHRISR